MKFIAIIIFYISLVKILSFISALYFIGLTLVPCTDFDGQAEPLASLGEDIENHHNHNHHDDRSPEDCSPLCYCQCCHINIVLTDQFFLMDGLVETREVNTFFLADMPNTPQEKLLRPPRA